MAVSGAIAVSALIGAGVASRQHDDANQAREDSLKVAAQSEQRQQRAVDQAEGQKAQAGRDLTRDFARIRQRMSAASLVKPPPSPVGPPLGGASTAAGQNQQGRKLLGQ